MLLHSPFKIGSRLLPCLTVGGAEISLKRDDYASAYTGGGRDVFEWFIDLPDGQEFSAADLKSGMQGAELQEMFASLLSFLSACGEGLRYQESTGRESENADLFPAPVAQWAAAHSDELSMLQSEIEEAREAACDLIEE